VTANFESPHQASRLASVVRFAVVDEHQQGMAVEIDGHEDGGRILGKGVRGSNAKIWKPPQSLLFDLVAIGCQMIEGRGSRVRFAYNGVVVAFHLPHPAKEAKPYQLEQARDFLTVIGVKP
jgi:hypothetical protein